MKYRISFFILSIFLITLSCSEKKEMVSADTVTEIVEVGLDPAKVQNIPRTDLYSNGKTKLIKTLNYRFEVENVNKSTEAIEAAVKKYPAYISSSKLHLENPVLENRITIRVQNEYFQDIIKDIDQQAKFINFRDVTTDDVAKEFVDLESRLKSKREVEARYMDILRKKAGTIEELLDAEQKIGELHEEIEATISRINYLKEQVSYSTINLEFYQTITQELTVTQEVTRKEEFTTALSTGWNGVVSVGIALTYLWPIFFIGILVGLGYKYMQKRKALKAAQL